jgi:hypothetical protein
VHDGKNPLITKNTKTGKEKKNSSNNSFRLQERVAGEVDRPSFHAHPFIFI